MKKLPTLSGSEVIKILIKNNFKVVGRKSRHIRLKKKDGETRIVIVPDHKEIKKGTLSSILRQAGLSRKEFLELLDR